MEIELQDPWIKNTDFSEPVRAIEMPQFREQQSDLSNPNTIKSELMKAMAQVEEHNNAGMSRTMNDAVTKLILKFNDATEFRQATEPSSDSEDTLCTKYTYWQDNSTRSRYKLFIDPGRFWYTVTFDRRSKAHKPEREHAMW